MPTSNATEVATEYTVSLAVPAFLEEGALPPPAVKLARTGQVLALAGGLVLLLLAGGPQWTLWRASGLALVLGGAAVALYGLSLTHRDACHLLPGERYGLPAHSTDDCPALWALGTVVTFYQRGTEQVLGTSDPVMTAKAEVVLRRSATGNESGYEVAVTTLP